MLTLTPSPVLETGNLPLNRPGTALGIWLIWLLVSSFFLFLFDLPLVVGNNHKDDYTEGVYNLPARIWKDLALCVHKVSMYFYQCLQLFIFMYPL